MCEAPLPFPFFEDLGFPPSPLPFALLLAAFSSGLVAPGSGLPPMGVPSIGSSGWSGFCFRLDGIEISVLHRHHEVLHDVILPLWRVFAHIKGQDSGGVCLRRVLDLAQAHVFADELFEFARRNFSQSFETRNLAALTQR